MKMKCAQHNKSLYKICCFPSCSSSNRFQCKRCEKDTHKDHKKFLYKIDPTSVFSAVQSVLKSATSLHELDQLEKKNEKLLGNLANLATQFSQHLSIYRKLIQPIDELESSQLLTGEEDQSFISEYLTFKLQEIEKITNDFSQISQNYFNKHYEKCGHEINNFFDLRSFQEEQEDPNIKKDDWREIHQQLLIFIENNKINIKVEDVNLENEQNSSMLSEYDNNNYGISSSMIQMANEVFTSDVKKPISIKKSPNLLSQDKNMEHYQKSESPQTNSLKYESCNEFKEVAAPKNKIQEKNENLSSQNISQGSKLFQKPYLPQKLKNVELGEFRIFDLNKKLHFMVFSQMNTPEILRSFSLDHDRDFNLIDFKEVLVTCAISQDGNYIAGASENKIKIYNTENFNDLLEFEGIHQKKITKINFISRDQLLVLYEDNSIEIYSQGAVHPCKSKFLNSQKRSATNQYICQELSSKLFVYLKQEIKSICLLDSMSLGEENVVSEKYMINNIEISEDKSLIVTSGLSDSISLYKVDYDKRELKFIKSLKTEHTEDLTQAAFINNNQMVVTISQDCSWGIYDIDSEQQIFNSLEDFQLPIVRVEYIKDLNQIILVDLGGNLISYQLPK